MDGIKDLFMAKITPSQQCKQAGLKSLAEVSRLTNVCQPTLYNWFKNKPELFNVVIAGCVALKDK